jgi:hypothetical protein
MAQDDKKNPKPKPWYLGWGLARFAGEAKEKRKKKIQTSEAAKELERQKRGR